MLRLDALPSHSSPGSFCSLTRVAHSEYTSTVEYMATSETHEKTIRLPDDEQPVWQWTALILQTLLQYHSSC
jgi:hypothetical protein